MRLDEEPRLERSDSSASPTTIINHPSRARFARALLLIVGPIEFEGNNRVGAFILFASQSDLDLETASVITVGSWSPITGVEISKTTSFVFPSQIQVQNPEVNDKTRTIFVLSAVGGVALVCAIIVTAIAISRSSKMARKVKSLRSSVRSLKRDLAFVQQYNDTEKELIAREINNFKGGEIWRGTKRRFMNGSIGSENLKRSYFRTRCASCPTTAIILTRHANPFRDSLCSSQSSR